MKTVRNNVFETNSSSVHAIVISKTEEPEIPENLPEIIVFENEEDLVFGWENEYYGGVIQKLGYLYAATEYYPQYRPVLLKFADDLGIHVLTAEEGDEDWGCIDHAEDLKDFVETVFGDFDLFKRFLFCYGSFIMTGNDNEDYDGTDGNVYSVLKKYKNLPGYILFKKGN